MSTQNERIDKMLRTLRRDRNKYYNAEKDQTLKEFWVGGQRTTYSLNKDNPYECYQRRKQQLKGHLNRKDKKSNNNFE